MPNNSLDDKRSVVTPLLAIVYMWPLQKSIPQNEIAGPMAADAAETMYLAMSLTRKFDASIMEQVIGLECKTDCYESALGAYLVKLSGVNLPIYDNRIFNTLLYSISDIERIGDHALAVAKAAREIT